jgi:predicted nucleotidyltransferase component of viral defense system
MKITLSFPKQILPFLKDKVDDYYLAGGTALSMFYYEHRESFDLDFFTQEFSGQRVLEITDGLKDDSHWPVELVAQQNKEGLLRQSVYSVDLGNDKKCKIDFVEDFVKLLNPLKRVDGINILSLKDIYLRKIYTIAGHRSGLNDVGQRIALGGRQEAKDFYDVYCLSTITMPLSEFVSRHCEPVMKEGIVRWYRTYDRMEMKTGLLDLPAKIKPDYALIEKHFKKEIDKLLESLIEGE